MDLERFELMATAADGTTDLCRLEGCTLDMAVSDDPDDNDFTLSCPVSGFVPEDGAMIYVDGTEIGGVVEGRGTDSQAATVEVVGRTWSGLLDSRVIRPPAGADYYTYSGDIRAVLRSVISATDLTGYFTVASGSCGKTISGSFDRYCSVWEGLRKELKRVGWRPSATWNGTHWLLDAVEARTIEVSAQDARVTSDAGLAPYNHLICAGEGELKDRVIVDLYANAAGQVSQTQTLTGKAERAALYDRTSSDRDELIKDGTEKLQELQATPTLAVDLSGLSINAAVGDSICVTDDEGGTEVTAEVSRTVAKVADSALHVTVEGGNTRQTRSLTGSSEASGESAAVTPVDKGGTGATTKTEATNNLAAASLIGGTLIPNNADLNNYRTVGNYYCPANASVQTLANKPSNNAFRMTVSIGVGASGNTTTNESYIRQDLYTYQGETFCRVYADKVWGSWLRSYDSNDTIPVANGGTGQTRLTGNPGLIHSMFDNTITSGTLYFPVFTGGWADGGYMSNDQLRSYFSIGDSGWQTFSSGGWTGGFRKVGKFVHLSVQSASTTSSGWITCPYTMPSGYRPSMFGGRDNVQGAAYGNDVIGNNIARWYVGTNGKIMVAHYGGANTWVDFSCVYFAG